MNSTIAGSGNARSELTTR